MPEARVAIIGGSGFYQMGLTDMEEVRIERTPFGPPSDAIVIGTLDGVRVAFLPRHGRGHRILPSELPSQANVYALKTLGVEFIIAVCAVGSLRREIEPRQLAVPDQLIDRTKGRPSTFFGQGLTAHIAFADPFCPVLRDALWRSAQEAGGTAHNGGTLLVMEGPAFSTRAESNLYRAWGADLIVMTALPEAKLAREAEICYATLACVTDYDCWYEGQESVTAEMILSNLTKTVEAAQRTVRLALSGLPARRDCLCASALQDALVTPLDMVPEETKRNLAPIIGRYVTSESTGS
ncbi:MAG: S-methyl-5'-thioadenosine phosphorylase [Dehalococcoidia bacterium SM23_28_2]|nr:MAG: S-methyl-5'-thioadenosine phosphorylase [Dehalococcoidia bacterium SM23_28_2]